MTLKNLPSFADLGTGRQILFWALALGFAAPASAQVWKYVDANGTTHFTNEPVPNALIVIPGDAKTSPDLGVLREDQARRTLSFVESQSSYNEVRPHLLAAAKTHGVEPDLIKAVAATESAFNPQAVSHKGAVGLMQIMPATANQYGVKAEPGRPLLQKLKEPAVNIEIGTRYLADLTRLYPDRLDLVLASYNAGQGAVSRAGHQIPNYRETQDYVRKVLAIYKVLQKRS